MIEFLLTGPRGNNPLGFLTALGAVLTLDDAGHCARLGWDGTSPRLFACFDGLSGSESEEERHVILTEALYGKLRRERGERAAQTAQARKEMELAANTLKKKVEEIKRRRLDRKAAKEARGRELEPLQADLSIRTTAFKNALIESAADPSVTLGKNLTETNAELTKHVGAACEQSHPASRRWVDLAAAYGVGDPADPEGRMLASPWALIRGDGKQNFLSTVEELMLQCTVEHFRQALWGPWKATDEKYSLRLEPTDDRRYALVDRDPTANDNKPRTFWGANRLAFEALRFFPTMPIRGGMGVRAWRATDGNWHHDCVVRWPLWRHAIGIASIQGLLGLRDLWLEDSAARERLDGLGICAVMESRRIATAKKFCLTPAVPVWISNSHNGSTEYRNHV